MSSTTKSHATFQSSFTKKRIDVTFKVASGALGPTADTDTVTLTEHRVRATITREGMWQGANLNLRVEGMTMAMMNRLSVVIGMPDGEGRNNQLAVASTVTVQAGDAERGMSTIFSGGITEAFVDFTGAPNVALVVSSTDTVQSEQLLPLPSTFPGVVSVSTIFSLLARKATGLKETDTAPVAGNGAFVGHGMTSSMTVTNYYAWGSALQQIHDLATSLHAFYAFDVSGTLHVWAQNDNTSRDSTTIKISNKTGLIGYPAYNQAGVSLTCLFNPALDLRVPFDLESEYRPAGWVDNGMGQTIPKMPSTGLWLPLFIAHDLASEIPNGPWFTQVTAIRNDLPANRTV